VRKLHIQNEKVRLNLALVAETIRHQKRLESQRHKRLSFVLDPQTGLLQIPTLTAQEGEGLKLIEIYFDMDKHQVHITEKKHADKMFDLSEIDPKGRQVFTETCHYLKEALLHLHEIHEFAHLEFDPSLDDIKGRRLLHEAWHGVEREDAEMMLLNTTPGTYLFRKDRFAGVMEEILSAAKKSRIKCFTLTYLDPESQVRDKTIVSWHDHWLFYDDDPTLSGKYFQTMEELLASLGTVLKRPLPALKIQA
jgi:hypothetical protein